MRKLNLGTPITILLFLVGANLVRAQQPQLTVELIKTFDYPGAGVFQSAGAINSQGNIAITAGKESGTSGLIRFHDGRFSFPIQFPQTKQTFLVGINDERLLCGSYTGSDGTQHGFFDAVGVFTSYDVPGAILTTLRSVNNAADFTGNYQSPTAVFLSGFVSLGGIVSAIEIPEAGGTVAGGINNRSQVVGFYLEENFFIAHGFLRAANGKLTYPIDFPGTNVEQTDLEAINDNGFVVGSWLDGSGLQHGLALQLPDTFVSFDVAGADRTVFTGINDLGIISGYYYLNGVYQGLIARLRVQ